MKRDKAIETAIDILHGLICECGHVEGEHLMFTETTKCGEKRCRCHQFRPVRLRVERER